MFYIIECNRAVYNRLYYKICKNSMVFIFHGVSAALAKINKIKIKC